MNPNLRETLAYRGSGALTRGAIPTMVAPEELGSPGPPKCACGYKSERQTDSTGARMFARLAA